MSIRDELDQVRKNRDRWAGETYKLREEVERLGRLLRNGEANYALLEAKFAKARAALTLIRTQYGRVCAEYEVCTHAVCASSYGAWATADEALKELP